MLGGGGIALWGWGSCRRNLGYGLLGGALFLFGSGGGRRRKGSRRGGPGEVCPWAGGSQSWIGGSQDDRGLSMDPFRGVITTSSLLLLDWHHRLGGDGS